jgi:hypothetical protein
MREERIELFSRLAPILEDRGIAVPPAVRRLAQQSAQLAAKAAESAAGANGVQAGPEAGQTARTRIPEILSRLDEMSVRELEFVINEFVLSTARKQPNTQIADTAFVELEIDPGAEPGEREIRLVTRFGLTNPMRFEIGGLDEACEPLIYPGVPVESPDPVKPPILLNGQIRPGEIDRWRISAQKGRRLVISAEARSLNPFLADAVPGWFQAVLVLYDSAGREVAFADDYRFDPDPVMLFEVPGTGVYELEVRDAIYRGRQDFVYRVSVAEGGFAESIFPLGGRRGRSVAASVDGWNARGSLVLDCGRGEGPAGPPEVRRVAGGLLSLSYLVDSLADRDEKEPNGIGDAQTVEAPLAVNGRISPAGDEDAFRFAGRMDEQVVVEVFARRLGSPLDSIVRLTDASGRIVAWNDDAEDVDGYLYRDMGVLTHHADSYLHAVLPADGTYFVRVADAQEHGGADYGYRLHVRRPMPDFELSVAPSSLTLIAGSLAAVRVHALRKDGFDGPIELALEDAPAGSSIQGGVIPAGCSSVRVTVGAGARAGREPIAISIVGRALVDGRRVAREAVPCEDMMQAFLYRHLVPSQQLVALVTGRGGRLAPPVIESDLPVRIRPGAQATVRVSLPARPFLDNVHLELSDPPDGMTLKDAVFAQSAVTFALAADPDRVKPGVRGNLIVEAFTERTFGQNEAASPARKRRVSIGFLPAIPVEIVSGKDS